VHGGDRLPWVKADMSGVCQDNFTPLTSLDWQVHVYGDAAPEIQAMCEGRQLPLHVFPWRPEMGRTGLRRNAAYLVRPDGYVALADPEGRATPITAYLDARKLTPNTYGFDQRRRCRFRGVSFDEHTEERRQQMRVMVIVKASKESEAGQMPSEKLLTEMGKFNEELGKAGVMLAGDGLHPSSKGKRVRFSGGNRTVIDGPFAETKELIAGFWLWRVKSIEDAVEWLKRAPFDGGTEVEIRPVFEADDFGKEFTPELRAQEERLRAQIEKRH